MHHGIATAIAREFLTRRRNRKELPQREANLVIFRRNMHRNRNRIVTAEKSQPISQKESLRTVSVHLGPITISRRGGLLEDLRHYDLHRKAVENASPYSFACQGSRGFPNTGPKYRTRARVTKIVEPPLGSRPPSIGRGEKAPTPKISGLLRKRPVLLRANFVLTKDRKRPYYGHFCGKIHRERSCSKAAGGP